MEVSDPESRRFGLSGVQSSKVVVRSSRDLMVRKKSSELVVECTVVCIDFHREEL